MTGCCSFDEKDLEFDKQELRHFADYKKGDTIFFESTSGDIDTIEIMGFKNEIFDKCGGIMAPRPSNTCWLTIKHLPKDNWHGTSQDMTKDGKIEIDHQGLLWITKYPIGKTIQYAIDFKDFHSTTDSVIGQFFTEPLDLNNLTLTNYYKVQHGYPERITDSIDIEVVYWTDQAGLVAYRNKGGEIWTKKK
jgi:hypothetical protein